MTSWPAFLALGVVTFTAAAGCAPSSNSPASTAPTTLVTISGLVTEGAPTQTRPIAGARLEVIAGANKGAVATTDSQGRYSLPAVYGDLTLQLSREGFATRDVQVTTPSDGSAVNLQLLPPFEMVTEVSGSESTGLFNANSLTVPVYNAGEIAITDLKLYGFEAGDGITIQILQDGVKIAESFFERSVPRNTVLLRAQVTAGHVIEVKGGYWTTLSFRHPR